MALPMTTGLTTPSDVANGAQQAALRHCCSSRMTRNFADDDDDNERHDYANRAGESFGHRQHQHQHANEREKVARSEQTSGGCARIEFSLPGKAAATNEDKDKTISEQANKIRGEEGCQSTSCVKDERNARGKESLLVSGGENARCCSRRRATLSGLIELFEQQVRVVDNYRKQLDASHWKERLRGERKMRDIITRVKYEPSSESATGGEEDGAEEEEVEREVKRHSFGPPDERSLGCCCARHESSIRSRDALGRIRSLGAIQVLPSNGQIRARRRRMLARKLTETRWQPPTDWRKYERRPLSSPCPYAAENASKSATSAEQANHNIRPNGTASSLATRGPPIVKHSTSSSKRLLRQLARLRRRDEPEYRVKRPASVARIEQLIEQLERATSEWDEDEHLLDRAERRDWTAAAPRNDGQRPEQQSVSPEARGEQRGRLDFGRRSDVEREESESIARSHSSGALPGRRHASSMQPAHGPSASALQETHDHAEHTHGLATTRQTAQRRPPYVGDRYFDDLAVRRLSRSSSIGSVSGADGRRVQGAQMSYLLCSNAYTPPIEPAADDKRPWTKWRRFQEERQARDDLHFRSLNRRSVTSGAESEPPFGVPKSLLGRTTMATASSMDGTLPPPKGAATGVATVDGNRANPFVGATLFSALDCDCRCQCIHHLEKLSGQMGGSQAATVMCHQECSAFKQQLRQQPRSDSRVSFQVTQEDSEPVAVPSASEPTKSGGRASADSGFVAQTCASSPASPLGGAAPVSTSSSLAREHPNERAANVDEQSLFVETDLDEVPVADWCWIGPNGRQQLQSVERHQAELRATPTRRRPRISLENPRAKSPLLRASSHTSQRQSGVRTFLESDLDSGQQVNVLIQTYSDSMKRRREKEELECEFQFEEDEEEQDQCLGRFRRQPSRRFITTSPIEQEPGSSSSASSKAHSEEPAKTEQTPTGAPPRPKFSIGEYKSLNRSNLKIL